MHFYYQYRMNIFRSQTLMLSALQMKCLRDVYVIVKFGEILCLKYERAFLTFLQQKFTFLFDIFA